MLFDDTHMKMFFNPNGEFIHESLTLTPTRSSGEKGDGRAPDPKKGPKCDQEAPDAEIVKSTSKQFMYDLTTSLNHFIKQHPPSNSHSHPDCQFFRNPQVQGPEVELEKQGHSLKNQ